jgi:hypothetical protein
MTCPSPCASDTTSITPCHHCAIIMREQRMGRSCSRVNLSMHCSMEGDGGGISSGRSRKNSYMPITVWV